MYGDINVNAAATYISVDGKPKAKSESTTLPNAPYKLGFNTYVAAVYEPGDSAVWVSEAAPPPFISAASGALKSGRVGVNYSSSFIYMTAFGDDPDIIVEGNLPPGLSPDKLPVAESWDIYFKGIPTTPGLYTFQVYAKDSNGTSAPATFSIEIEDGANPLTISPTHAILTSSADTVTFQACLNIPSTYYYLLEYDKSETPDMEMDVVPKGNGIYDVKVQHKSAAPEKIVSGTLAFTVKYPDGSGGFYEATSTIEIIPGGIDTNTTAKVLETKVAVNRAKEIGALVPVLITNQKPQDLGITAFSVPKTGSQVALSVELYTQNGKNGPWDKPVPGYTANMYGADQRYIEINADSTAKKTSKVGVFLRASGAAALIPAGVIDLSVSETWPRLTVKAGQPNLFYNKRPVPLTVTSPAGACTVLGIIAEKAPEKDYLSYSSVSELQADNTKMKNAGTVSVFVKVAVEGYKPLPSSLNPKVKVKVVNTAPKIKLSQTSVSLMPREVNGESYDDYAEIWLITGDKKVPFESDYKILNVEISDEKADGKPVNPNANADVKYDPVTGVISVRPKSPETTIAGTQMLKVSLQGSDNEIYLQLTVKLISKPADIKKILPFSTVKSATVNVDRDPYLGNTSLSKKIVEIPISVSAQNFVGTDWYIESIGKNHDNIDLYSDLKNALTIVQTGRNRVALQLKGGDLEKLTDKGKDKSYILNIGSQKLHDVTDGFPTFPVTLKVSDKPPGFTVSQKGKIDIANTESGIDAAIKFTNGDSEIASVKLYNDSACTIENESYTVAAVSGTSFRIAVTKGKKIVPGVKQNLWVVISLKSGGELRSPANKPLAFTPSQTAAKATQSLKAVTLYKSTPQYGSEGVLLGLTTPANVRIGEVVINQASVNSMKLSDGGFRLEQNSANTYSIYFAGGRAPGVLGKDGRLAALKSAYTLKLDLWAEGTYTLNSAGQPLPLTDPATGKAMSKPTTISIKVMIK